MTPSSAGSGRARCQPASIPAAPPKRYLAGLDDGQLLAIARSQPLTRERSAARDVLVARHRSLVRSCVSRYRRGPVPAEDLMQVGYVGLMKAINKFDPAFGRSLAAYAQPTIVGE